MIKKLQKNKACPQCLKHSFCRQGFVLLFAVTLSAILLSIALGITNIAFREVKFSTNARDTNDAFFAADTGAESTLFDDKDGSVNGCVVGNTCVVPAIQVGQLGSLNKSCFIVTLKRETTETTIVSKGYNIGSGGAYSCVPPSNAVERQVEVSY